MCLKFWYLLNHHEGGRVGLEFGLCLRRPLRAGANEKFGQNTTAVPAHYFELADVRAQLGANRREGISECQWTSQGSRPLRQQ